MCSSLMCHLIQQVVGSPGKMRYHIILMAIHCFQIFMSAGSHMQVDLLRMKDMAEYKNANVAYTYAEIRNAENVGTLFYILFLSNQF